jgi:hypothetical protein
MFSSEDTTCGLDNQDKLHNVRAMLTNGKLPLDSGHNLGLFTLRQHDAACSDARRRRDVLLMPLPRAPAF